MTILYIVAVMIFFVVAILFRRNLAASDRRRL